MAQPYLGQIIMFGGNFAPLGWAFCDGQLLSIAKYDQLYGLIGTTYGGDGVDTFAVPDLRGRVPIHTGQGAGLSNRVLGESAGSETITLNSNQMPSHTHSAACSSSPGNSTSPTGNYWAANANASSPQFAAALNNTMNAAATSAAGNSQPHDNLMPILAINFIIALEGLYPSPN